MPWILVFLLQTAAVAEDPVLVSQSSSGSIAIDGENLLIIGDIAGTFSLRGGKEGTLRFEGRSLDEKREHREVALWRDGDNTLLIGPAGGAEGEAILVDIAIPPEIDVEITTVGGRLLASALYGDFSIEAEDTKVAARGLQGGAEFVTTGGTVAIDGVKGAFSLTAVGTEGTVKHLYADGEFDLKKSKIGIEDVVGELQAAIEETDLGTTRVEGRLRLVGNGGTLRVAECTGGGEIEIEDTPMSLRQSKGALTLRTNATVAFEQYDGELAIVSYGAEIQGSDSLGSLMVENNSAPVTLKKLGGTTEVRGSGMTLKINDANGPLNVHTVSTDIAINVTQADVVIENDYGDIQVGDGKGKLKIASKSGAVTVTGQGGPLDVQAEGPLVDVTWTKFGKPEKIVVQNAGGDVRLVLPPTARCQLRVEAPQGRVVADLPGIEIADDGRSATGEFTGGKGAAPQLKKPMIQASSVGGNVYVEAATPSKD
jgi:hypothetical protein